MGINPLEVEGGSGLPSGAVGNGCLSLTLAVNLTSRSTMFTEEQYQEVGWMQMQAGGFVQGIPPFGFLMLSRWGPTHSPCAQLVQTPWCGHSD